jgi:hypothetical protein
MVAGSKAVQRYPGRISLRCGQAGKRREIPDELYRGVKAKGRSVSAITVELLRACVGEQDATRSPSLHDRMRIYCGVVDRG